MGKEGFDGRLEAAAKKSGLNDIVVRNDLPTEAIRFNVKLDGKKLGS